MNDVEVAMALDRLTTAVEKLTDQQEVITHTFSCTFSDDELNIVLRAARAVGFSTTNVGRFMQWVVMQQCKKELAK